MANDFTFFTKRMRERADQVVVGANNAVRTFALAINQVVILETPVKTGHARANWQVSLSKPILEELDAEDPGGQSTVNKNAALIKTSPPGVRIILSNNVPYINQLNDGSSAQAPAQFVQQSILAAGSALRKVRVFK